jgi:hypothetical protein
MVELRKARARIPPGVNVSVVVWGFQSGCAKWWLYDVSIETSVDVVRVNCDVRSTATTTAPQTEGVRKDTEPPLQ